MNDMPYAARVIALAVQRDISIWKAKRIVRKAIIKAAAERPARRRTRMNISTEEFRRKAEAVARGEVTPKAKVKAKPASKVKPGVKPATKPAPKPKATTPKPATWVQAVTLIQKRDKCSASVAGRKACDEFPNLHPARRGRKS